MKTHEHFDKIYSTTKTYKKIINDEVWVTGIGLVSSIGAGQKIHLHALKNEISGIKSHCFFKNSPPDPVMSGIIPNNVLNESIEESSFNRADKILEIAFKEALESSSLSTKNNSEIIIGTTLGNMYGAASYYCEIKSSEPKLKKTFISNSPAEYVAKKFKINGKTTTISSACSSGISAIGYGYRKILWGESTRVITGGVEALSPFIIAGFNSLKLLSKAICKPFDANRDGLNPAEGAAVLVLESKCEAEKRKVTPIAKIVGFGEALEGYHFTQSNPNGKGIEQGIHKTLKSSKISFNDISYIHLHGTATIQNDISEYNGIKNVFGENLIYIPVCSTKSITGHTFGAAGAISSVLSILSLKNNFIPLTLNHNTKDKNFKELLVYKSIKYKNISNIIVTSLGFGGETAVICIKTP